jgi:AcrR family transcriptional regulator
MMEMKQSTPRKRRPMEVNPSASSAMEDHRVRTGAARREQTRKKLLAAALAVFAEKGTDAPLIEDFIGAAGVARGTFYNYFSTTQSLLAAVTAELSDEIMVSIDAEATKFKDPVQRMVCGCLLYMHLAVDFRPWGEFMTRAGLRSDALGKLLDIYLPRDLELALKSGQAAFPSLRAARDLMLGSMITSVATVLGGTAPRSHLRETFQLSLQGIGIAPAEAARLCGLELPAVTLPRGFGFS